MLPFLRSLSRQTILKRGKLIHCLLRDSLRQAPSKRLVHCWYQNGHKPDMWFDLYIMLRSRFSSIGDYTSQPPASPPTLESEGIKERVKRHALFSSSATVAHNAPPPDPDRARL